MKMALKVLSVSLVFLLAFSSALVALDAVAAAGTEITYNFKNESAGYAEGTLTLTSDTAGKYSLYWADDTDALSGFYPIVEFNLEAGDSQSFKFGYHTAIPAKATRVIAKNSAGNVVADYSLPASKRLNSGKPLYKFNSYSDVHIDNGDFYTDASTHWAEALKYAVDTESDFIVSSGDTVTNASGPDVEWDMYEKILADSGYVNPIWESNGNHDLRTGKDKGIKAFMRATGTDSTIANYDANKPYFYMVEKATGDVFIFMALEGEYSPGQCSEFSDEQMAWLTNLLSTYYGTGVNIYIVEHAPIDGFGAGDRMSNPYYKAHLSECYMSTVQFKSLLQKYPKLIFMSGHTHIDFSLGYNFSDENGTACSMIHNPAVVGSTKANDENTALDYNDGKGYNSQGYLVEVYSDSVIYYGANLTDELIYPAYCYIMDGARNTAPDATNDTEELTTRDPSDTTGVTGSTLPEGIETKRIYFANTKNWGTVNCHSWTNDNQTVCCTWPGYGAVFCGFDENDTELYYCDIPAEHTGIVWNNGGNNSQTVDITLDGTNDFFTPNGAQDGKYTVNASKWEYEPVSDPSVSSEPSSSNNSEPEYVSGDANLDGRVSVRDVTTIQLKLAGKINFNDEQNKAADTDGTGTITINDATLIQMFLINRISKLPLNMPAPDGSKGKYSVGASKDDAKTYLDAYYSFASYDQYQALKKLYKNGGTDSEFDAAIAALKEIAEHIGTQKIFDYRNIYYFENTYDWSNVYAYAWSGSSNNASWPGAKMQKVGTNYGHDVYGIKFDYAGQFKSVIFNSGQGGCQTIDIALEKYEHNCFYLSGTGSDGKCTVGNFDFNSPVEPTLPTTTEHDVSENEHYAMVFYQKDVHAWDTVDTFFSYENSEYILDYTSTSANNISLSLFNNKNSKYLSLQSSGSVSFSSGASSDFTLTELSTRGKSITISGLAVGSKLRLKFSPDTNKLTISCIE